MEKKSFWKSLRKKKWLASTGMLAAGALAVYGVWQIPSMNQYHMETLDTPIMEDEKQPQNDKAGNMLELPRDENTQKEDYKEMEMADTEEGSEHTLHQGAEEQITAVGEESKKEQNPEKTGDKKSDRKNDAKMKEKEASVEVLSNPQSVLDAGNFDESAGLSWPMEGDVILNYDTEGVVYFQTLAQYKANPAIMIAGEVGEKVRACADGVVKEIVENEETGVTLKMDAGNSYEIVYGQLENLKVSEGDTIKEGAVLGTLAEPTDYFTLEGPNLYFQILQENTPVNPLLLLK